MVEEARLEAVGSRGTRVPTITERSLWLSDT
jgi:hypothetical protein